MQWYEAEEEGAVYRNDEWTGNDLFDSYAQQEIEQEEQRKRQEMQEAKNK